MAINTAQISNPSISINPSLKLKTYINNIEMRDDLPLGISRIVSKNKVQNISGDKVLTDIPFLIDEQDKKFIKSLNFNNELNHFTKLPIKCPSAESTDKLLNLRDLYWLYNYIQEQNKQQNVKIYLHELLEGSDIYLPKNRKIPRNTELEKRCQILRAEQENKHYHEMTRNVDNVKKCYPEDSIGYQVKQMNRSLLAIFQFILSVVAGFAFGFIGIELIIGSLDFGFRLLLGIICALTIALAELYFLAKKLNEDMQFESAINKQHKNIKLE